ncbi:oxidoreductase [Kitasatospora cinereorecta]|uniref:Oxidoreductase n=1 Tax=Kitasatospora cinereorecta TaxID=285560 RepID=A0ABW0VKK9_9ACTN
MGDRAVIEQVRSAAGRTGGALAAATAATAAAAAATGADAADRDRRLAPATVTALTAAGFPRHFVPARWGGTQGGFAELLTATATVAEGCASAAWCAMLWAAHGRFAAFLPPDGQGELWGDSPDIRIAAAVLPPAGQAIPDRDGWLLHGRWSFASGVEHAEWILLAAPDAAAPDRGARVFALPRDAVRIEDTWDSTGLRGTGSHAVVLPETRVPAHRSFAFADLLRGDPAAPARCHAVPAHLPGGLLFAAPALGAARRAMAAWTERAAPGLLDGSAAARETLARSGAEIDAVALLLRAAAERADTGPVDAAAVARNRRDAAVAVDLLTGAVERLLRTSGTGVLAAPGELQRCWRDIHVIASHGALRLEPAAADHARSLTHRA